MGVIRLTTDRVSDKSGQATVEWAAALPIFIIVAALAVNALSFLSECAAFDRMFRGAVRVHASAPAYGQTSSESCELITKTLDAAFSADNLSVSVSTEATSTGNLRYVGTLSFSPTLFGLGLKESIFGVELPRLTHSSSLTINTYKPGIII